MTDEIVRAVATIQLAQDARGMIRALDIAVRALSTAALDHGDRDAGRALVDMARTLETGP